MFPMIRAGKDFGRLCERPTSRVIMGSIQACFEYRVTKEGYKSKLSAGFDMNQVVNLQLFARVAQLDRASASEAEGCGFDPRHAHQPSLSASLRASARQARFNFPIPFLV